jgi:hypothetical protein
MNVRTNQACKIEQTESKKSVHSNSLQMFLRLFASHTNEMITHSRNSGVTQTFHRRDYGLFQGLYGWVCGGHNNFSEQYLQ